MLLVVISNMVTQDQLLTLLSHSSLFFNQYDLFNLALTSKKVHDEFATKKLYRCIHITRDPIIRSPIWYLDGNTTYLSGYRAVKKTADQNDLFLHERIERLLESSHLDKIEEIIVEKGLFADHETCTPILRKLLDQIVVLNKVKTFEIRDQKLFREYYLKSLELTNLNRVTIVDLNSIGTLRSPLHLKKLKWILVKRDMTGASLAPSLKKILCEQLEEAELVADEVTCCSLNIFLYLQKEGVKFQRLQSLKFNYTHNLNGCDSLFLDDPISVIESVVDLGKLKKLELGVSCEHADCDCMDAFLSGLAPKLNSLRYLALIEKNTMETTNHKAKEDWDIITNRFVMRLPYVGQNLLTLSIRHATPLNGLSEDSVAGNYVRRRTLFETVLPKLTALQNLIAPNILQSLSAYEFLVCDLLWNGCECNACSKILPIFDQYLMNHQHYLVDEGRYTDVTPTVFFAYAGDFLMQRFSNHLDWDLDIFSIAPSFRFWNLHGYDNLHHFDDYRCFFDETTFAPLCMAISHFFNGYMDHLVHLLPNLRTAVLSGIYYAVDSDSHEYISVYD